MDDPRQSHIAVIGMSGRFPGAPTVAELWDNLVRGVEGLTHFSAAELLAAGVGAADLADPSYVRTGALLPGCELFDHDFFGFTLREAEITDPQHRLFLECAWEALESAGYDPGRGAAPVGVYAGSSLSTYLLRLLSRPEVIRGLGRFRTILGNDKDFLPTWTSYKLDLRGPSVNLQTACSTSLVAVHLACQSLLNRECDMALAGGATVSAQQRSGYFFQEGGILSPDGHCRAFDARAQGTVGGNGVGVVVLKRFEDAWRDGDCIRAVLLGSAINNDGAVKIGYTAPSIEGQSRVISEALAVAGVEPGSIGYVEAHGTGTALGDPIEVEALTLAFAGAPRGSCALGSVKTNLGHLDAAAGVAGLIKTVLALENAAIPPSLHFAQPNPRIDFERTPFYVNASLSPWAAEGGTRRAGVSSFGIGGTNAHVVLEAAPPREPPAPSLARQLLVLSARTASALEAAAANLARHLRERPGLVLADVAYTLQTGRRAFPCRRAVVCGDAEEAAEALVRGDGPASSGEAAERRAAFLFPGQGAQHPGMTAGIYRSVAGFRADVDRCAALLSPRLGRDLRELLFGAGPEEELARTAAAQPALFVVEYALARLLISWGIEPAAMIGHSLGEYVAACLAGVFSLEDALALVAERGRLMQSLPGGAMLAVTLAADELQPWLGEGLSLAAVNGPTRSAVSGTAAAVAELEAELGRRGVPCRRVHTSHAFHSSMMDPAVAPFVAAVRSVRLAPPRIPFLSNVSGTWITPDEATSPEYWGRHLRLPVQLAAGLAEIRGRGDLALLEVGPGQALATLARQGPGPARVFAALGHPRDPEPRDDLGSVLAAVGALWCAGVPVDWARLHAPGRRLRVPLPTYPFERKRCWIDPPQSAAAASGSGEAGIRGSEEPMAEAPAVAAARAAAGDILALLGRVVHRLVGADPAGIDVHQPFLELGVDSLLLIQFGQEVKRETGVRISLTRFLEDLPTLAAVAACIDRELPPEARERLFGRPAAAPAGEPIPAAPPEMPPAAPPGMPAAAIQEAPAAAGSLEQLFERQLQLVSAVIAQQLEVVRQGGGRAPALVPPAVADPDPEPAPPAAAPRPAAFVPFQPVAPGLPGNLTPRQEAHLRKLVDLYARRTGGSKGMAERHRLALADNRNSVGFRLLWKEMIYPIVARRTAGSRMWDVDGNEYVDVAMGFGVYLLGHSPEIVVRALREQLELGIHIGPQSDLAGEVAELIAEMAGVERVAFTNSGTEAVMAALRLARAVTGRDRIALFAGAYHGTSDGVLARGAGGEGAQRAVPMAPGVTEKMVADVVLLDYAEPSALDYVRRHGHELAAVLVEPVQGRRPEVQPREFLHELRRLTREAGCALVFDEVVTGFRCHPGGAQAWFEVTADIVTYGKVIGGGMPIGVVAGRAEYLDAIDGGAWRFGDGSHPQVDKTMFAGTFCKHPLSMAAARAVLLHLKRQGPALQEELNRRTAELARSLNAWFAESASPVEVVHFGSQFRLLPRGPFRDLFFFHLVKNGIYVWEGNTCFLTTAHDDQDVELLKAAVRRSCEEMREGGFFPEAPSADGRAAESGGLREVPLTEGQREIWILSQMSPDVSRAYNESTTLDLAGPLDVAALRRAVQRVVDRHQALRSTVTADGAALRVAPRLDIPLPLADFTHLADPASDPGVAEWLRAELTRPFDLAAGPLLRAVLAKLAEERHQLVVTIHHLVIDGVSYGVFLHELSVLYAAERGLPAPPLQEPRQFGDWVELEQAARSQDARQAAEDAAYWTAELAGLRPVLDLPTDRPRPPVQTHGVERLGVTFPPALYRQAQELSARRGATLFVTLLAVFDVLLAQLSGQDDLAVAISAAGQVAMGERNLVGYCVRPLLVRSRLSPALRFSELLRSIKRSVLGAYEHQAYPLSRLVKALSPRRDPSRPPLAQVVFNVDRSTSPSFPGLEVGIVTNPTGSKVDLYWSLIETGTGLALDCDFNPDLFDRSTIARWAESFEALLAAVVEGDPSLAELAAVPPPGEAPSPLAGLTLPERFSRWAAEEPSWPALRFEDWRLSYGELERAANRLARYLRRRGVGAETLVGLSMQRSAELIVALLGILKAGAAYLPLDPGYPPARLSYMLEDSGVELLVTGPGAPPGIGSGVRRLDVGSEREAIERESGEALPGMISPQGLAYVIYTSGSTGRPKGVMVGHQGLANLAEAQVVPFGAGAGKRVLQFAPLSFDASIFEIAMAFGVGAELVLASRERLLPGPQLPDLLREEGITHVTLPPSALAALAESDLPELETIVCAGEALPESLVERWGEGRRLFNAYGPTETTVWATVSRCRPGEGKPDIGRAIAGARVLVLDGELGAVPQGAAGEIFLGGVGLARGYLGRPELTAERFVPDPWSPRPGERLYRTGDLGRWLAGGRLDFLGRSDRQVKIRGFRIEVGEVEAALGSHPELREVAVSALEEGEGKSLVAYVVARREPGPTVTELRRYLKERLPEHMVPASFQRLEELPHGPSGKVDRAALPAPGQERPALAAAFALPRSEAERLLAEVWCEVLGLDRVGIHDDFFELGGDSILAFQITSRASRAGLSLSPVQLFRLPTIAELAAASGAPPSAAADVPEPAGGEVPMTPIQHWFFAQRIPAPGHFNQAVLLQSAEPLDPRRLAAVLAAILRRHDALGLRFFCVGEEWRQREAEAAGPLPFLVVDLGGLPAEARRGALEQAASRLQASLDLARGPLTRLAVFRLGAGQADRLLWVIHHLAVDGVSWRILLEDLYTGYHQLGLGEPLDLPPATTPFRTWAERLHAHAGSDRLRGELDGWLDERRSRIGSLPVDFPGGRNTEGSASAVTVLLDRHETRSLLQDVTAAFQTRINDALLAALGLTLCAWTGRRSALIDLEGHGREPFDDDLDLSRTVGWFTTLFPVLLDLGPDGGPAEEVVQRVHRQLGRIPQRGLGYGVLRYLAGERTLRERLAALPRAEIGFNYLGQFDTVLPGTARWSLAPEAAGPTRGAGGDRLKLLEINGMITGGRLSLQWSYSRNLHRRETVERLAEEMLARLRSFVERALALTRGEFQAADFADFAWSQREVNEIAAAIGRAKGGNGSAPALEPRK